MKFFYIYLCSVLNIIIANGEVYTALVDLNQSFLKFNEFMENILSFIKIMTKNTIQIRSIANQLINISPNELNVVDVFNIYKLVKHSKWQEDLSDLERNDDIKKLLNKIKKTSEYLPIKSDMFGAADALIRLQITYRISTQNLANGILYRNICSNALTARECFEIGLRSFAKDYFYYIQWMNEAYNKIQNEDKYIEKVKILDHLSYGYFKQGNFRQALAFTNEWLKLDHKNERALQNKEYFENVLTKSKNSNLLSKGDNEYSNNEDVMTTAQLSRIQRNEFSIYEALCRGENPIVDKNSHLLKCRLFVPHQYFTIMPIKEETAFYNPKIVIYHDILNDVEIEEIKQLSISRLKRATVQNSLTGKLEYADYRISKSAWLTYDLTQITKKINDRIAIMTGMNLETAEELQVVNYGIGGHYEPHYDFARKQETNSFESEIGNRIATLIYYMSDIDAGGATVFTEIGAKIIPKKGSAAFWWNLLPNGDGDLLTRHAACPVLGGSKWIMNKWFHERGQEFIRPCCLQKF